MSAGAKFALGAAAASTCLFALLRLPWMEAHFVLPLTDGQAYLAMRMFGRAPTVTASLACSGTDAIALCLGAILAYPVTWRARLAGAGAGGALILALNTIRIGTLGQASARPALFNALHIYIWPAILTIAIAGYVFGWMQLTDRAITASTVPDRFSRPHPSRRFIVLSIVLLLLFIAAAPFYLQNAGVLAIAAFIGHAAARLLGAAGVHANATGNTLWTSHGGFVVTEECIATPLIPIYLAAVIAYAASWRWLVLGLAAALPLFVGLGIVRLLVVVVPATSASSTFFVHAFFQLLTGVVIVIAAARWRYRGGAAAAHAAAAVMAGALIIAVLKTASATLVARAAGATFEDAQGAIGFLPAFQIGLYVACWIAACLMCGWRRFAAGLAVLAGTIAIGLGVLHILADAFQLAAHVREVRGWAILAPLLIIALVTHRVTRHVAAIQKGT